MELVGQFGIAQRLEMEVPARRPELAPRLLERDAGLLRAAIEEGGIEAPFLEHISPERLHLLRIGIAARRLQFLDHAVVPGGVHLEHRGRVVVVDHPFELRVDRRDVVGFVEIV